MTVRQLLRSRTTAVWFGLIAATGLSWEMGHGLGFESARHAGVALLILAFVKVRFVMLDFMELRHAPRFMRGVAQLWCLSVCAGLILLFWTAPAAVTG